MSILKFAKAYLLVVFMSVCKLNYGADPVYANVVSYIGITTPDIKYNFTGIQYRIKTMVDTSQAFNSKYLRVKYSQNWSDTMNGLYLGKTYYIRAAYVDANNNELNTTNPYGSFKVAGYPVLGYVDFTQSKVTNISPVNKIELPYAATVDYDLLYDTVSDFSSPAMRVLLSKGQTISYTGLTKNKTKYYLRARVKFGNQLLDWKTVEVYNRLGVNIEGPIRNCQVSKPFSYNFSYISASTVFYSKMYMSLNGVKVDSLNLNTFQTKKFEKSEMENLVMIMSGKFELQGDTFIIEDTFKLNDMVKNEGPYCYQLGADSESFLFAGFNCPDDSLIVEAYTDSFLSNRFFYSDTFRKGNGSIYLPIPGYRYYLGHTIRCRSYNGAYTGSWVYLQGNVTPIRFASLLSANDSMSVRWPIDKNFVYKGQMVEIEVDISKDFSSPKKKSLILRDTNYFSLPMIFGKKNYARIRLLGAMPGAQWYGPIERSVFYGLMPNKSCAAVYPSFRLNQYEWNRENTMYRFSQNNQNLNKYTYGQIIPFGDLILGNNIYVQQRFFSELDTSVWSSVYTCPAANPSNFCCNPIILYNGVGNGLDTFIIRWKKQNDPKLMGFYVIVGTGNRLYGHYYLGKDDTEFTVNRNKFPGNWQISIEPDCDNTGNRDQKLFWPLDIKDKGALTYQPSVYYDSETGNLHSALSGKLYIFDLSGRIVFESQLESENTLTDLSELSEGVYIARLIQDGLLINIKFKR